MSRFWSAATAALTPYTPGEQPRERRYIKLNTNECPYPPSPRVAEAIAAFDAADLRLYPDPDAAAFTEKLARRYNLAPQEVLACGGSDEALAFAFMAFCDRGSPVAFPDITYGFYKVYASLFGLHIHTVPLREDFTSEPEDFAAVEGPVFLANPNAPTGIAWTAAQVEELLRQKTDRLVVVDEAYADFAADCSATRLIPRCDNLLVVKTFSKSRSLAGMRLGAAFGCRDLIQGMNRIKYSFNPYNLDRVSLAVGAAALRDEKYFQEAVAKILRTRERAAAGLEALGFRVLPSQANFLFASHPEIPGRELYLRLRERGILVRHFEQERIAPFVRISIGTDDEMNRLLHTVEKLA